MIDTIIEKTAFPKAWNTVPTIIQNHAMRKCTPIILSAGTPILSISSEALNIPKSTCGMNSKQAKPTKSRQNAVIRLTFIVLTIRFLF